MSARDDLMALVIRAAICGAYEGLCDEARKAMDDYAHELAEKIREASYAQSGPATQWDWWDADTIPGSCADLIDPEVTT